MTELTITTYGDIRPKFTNWRLRFGAILVLLILTAALVGPSIAPKDPLQEHFVAFLDDDTYVKAPFPAFLVPGFFLGTDEFGRDVFSRLLWGIKPTLMLTVFSAAIRLILGTIIGIFAGFKANRLTNAVNSIISLSVSVPVIFVALCVIAAGGQSWGVWAFVIGISLTGWGDAAQLVRDQTRIIASQLYIEASKALGSSRRQLLILHFIPQILPSIWMLLAFEISACILITAELGVLGYFTNAVWIPIGDWVAIRSSGMPELSQMLSELQKQPWSAFGAALFVFFSILGFNLLGEGLRLEATPEQSRRAKTRLGSQISNWVDERLFSPSASLLRSAPAYSAVLFISVLVIGAGVFLWQLQNQKIAIDRPPLPGDHQWVSTYRDPQGTLWVPYQSPQKPQLKWSLDLGEIAVAGPVVDARGTIYISTRDKFLHAVSPQGELLWSIPLPNTPLGSPALAPSGNIYVADKAGGLSMVSVGKYLKELIPGKSLETPSLTGPLVAHDGSVYHITSENITAFAATDELKWKRSNPTYSITNSSIRLSPDENFLLFEDFVLDAQSGALIFEGTREPMDRFIVGANDRVYLLTQAFLEEIEIENISSNREQSIIKWDSRSLGTNFRLPSNAGVTPEGYIWLHFGGLYENNRVVWLTPEGITLNINDYPYRRNSSFIAIDSRNTIVFCGEKSTSQLAKPESECTATPQRSSNAAFTITIDGTPLGGVLIKERLIIFTATGKLLSFEDSTSY